jgi:3-hydroxy-D-aspartate aldolase
MIDTSALPVPPQTPALVIDRTALMRNMAAMQAACDAKGVRLRAHGKMHKCSMLAKLQVEQGAVGLCCQTVGEAEAYARAGIRNLLVSAPMPTWGPERIAALAKSTGATLSAVCDSAEQIERLGAAARAAGVEISALVDVNIGMHRVGCSVEEAPQLAARIDATEGLHYGGIQAYFGHLQHLADGRATANAEGTATLKALVKTLTIQGLAPSVVTGGGTGTYRLDLEAGVFTELQCGSYALMDAEYLDCGAPDGDWPFEPALFIAASVVSAKHKSHVAVDVGLKASSFDVPPRVVAGAAPGSLWRSMGDEHGAIAHPAFFAALGGGTDAATIDANDTFAWQPDAPKEGDTVWLVPGHCDPTINLYDAFFVTREDGGLDRWPIDARRVSG